MGLPHFLGVKVQMLVVDRYWSRAGRGVNLTTKETAVGVLAAFLYARGYVKGH
jgi:hypothetical protein